MLVLNGVSHPRSTSRSYLLRSILPAVYFRPPPATIRRSSLMSSSCMIVTFLESLGSARRLSFEQPQAAGKRDFPHEGALSLFSLRLRQFDAVLEEFGRPFREPASTPGA